MTIKKGDFIEVEYTGKTAEEQIFDTTIESVAKEAGLNPKAAYKPAIICIGEGQLLKGLDDFLEGKELGKHSITLSPEKAFGKKDIKLMKLIPASKFKEARIQPHVGMEVNVDNHYGVVRSISGGRITVDFNHPLASKELTYDVEVKRLVEKPEEQVTSLLDNMGIHYHGVSMEGAKHVVIKVHDAFPEQFVQSLNQIITKLTKIETISYHVEKSDH